MLTSISPSNKGNIVTYKNKTNNSDSERDSGSDSGSDGDSINEGYGAKMTYTQDEPQIRHVYLGLYMLHRK